MADPGTVALPANNGLACCLFPMPVSVALQDAGQRRLADVMKS